MWDVTCRAVQALTFDSVDQRATSTIVGMSSIEIMEQTLRSSEKVLTQEEEQYLKELNQPRAISATPGPVLFTGRCLALISIVVFHFGHKFDLTSTTPTTLPPSPVEA